MDNTISINSNCWLTGNPIFSLTYEDTDKKTCHNDVCSFRPDPRDFMEANKKYKAKVILSIENDIEGDKELRVIRRIELFNGGKFARIR